MFNGKRENPPVFPLFQRGAAKRHAAAKRGGGLIAGLGLLLASGIAGAQGGYGALSYFDWSVDQSGLSKIESETVRATGGYRFNEHFGIEAHVATGGRDELTFAGEEAEAELNKLVAGFAKLNLPLLNDWVNVYGLVGYAFGKVDILAETTTGVVHENSFAWGAGADIALWPGRWSLTADYVEYINRTGVNADAVSIGVKLLFSGQ
jgi:opacity protein-like surface antigen